MKINKTLAVTITNLVVIFCLFVSYTATARKQLRIVGSSTVFPFSATVAENFGNKTKFKTPIVESTGSGGGLKLFCAGIGISYPDITNASRRIKKSEIDHCRKEGITPIEVQIGFDGIAFANSIKAKHNNFTSKDLFKALAKKVIIKGKLVNNPYRTWQQVNAKLPNIKIEVLGPPPTSGTRDAFVELAMGAGAKEFTVLKKLYQLTNKQHSQIKTLIKKIGFPSNIWQSLYLKKGNKLSGKDFFKLVAYGMREDGAFIEAGENDNLIIQKLSQNPNAFGIFGFSFLEESQDVVQGSLINGVTPSFENIAAGKYPLSRSLYFYVKQQHINLVPGIKQFVTEFISEDTWGDDGYLVDKGLIPLPATSRQAIKSSINNQLK